MQVSTSSCSFLIIATLLLLTTSSYIVYTKHSLSQLTYKVHPFRCALYVSWLHSLGGKDKSVELNFLLVSAALKYLGLLWYGPVTAISMSLALLDLCSWSSSLIDSDVPYVSHTTLLCISLKVCDQQYLHMLQVSLLDAVLRSCTYYPQCKYQKLLRWSWM
jgi:uncharacterized protein (DUF486 family)